MQLNAADILAAGPAPDRPDVDDLSPSPLKGSGLKAVLRRAVLMSAARVAPRLTADRLARRYLTPNQSVLDDLSTRRHGYEICDLGADTALLRTSAPAAPSGAPRVLIVPGHDGHVRQFTRIVRALRKRGVAVDILVFPGHTHNARSVCSMQHMVTAVRRADAFNGHYDGIVAHCVASNAMLQVLEQGMSCPRLAMISTPLDLPALVRFGGQQYGLSGRCLDIFVDRVNAISAPCAIDKPWRPVVETTQGELLVVHARNDYAAPIEKTRPLAAAWPGAQLAEFDQGGHNEILNVTSAIDRIADFMAPAQS